MSGGNGLLERKYFCVGCGHFLFATTTPPVPGTHRAQCAEDACSRMNLFDAAAPPPPAPDRAAWRLEMIQRRRQRAAPYS